MKRLQIERRIHAIRSLQHRAVMRRKSVTDMKVSRGSAVQTDAAYFGLRLKVLVSVSTVLVNHANSIDVVS
ncbi:MAG: hypothetical protein ACO20I_12330 [bacterium]